MRIKASRHLKVLVNLARKHGGVITYTQIAKQVNSDLDNLSLELLDNLYGLLTEQGIQVVDQISGQVNPVSRGQTRNAHSSSVHPAEYHRKSKTITDYTIALESAPEDARLYFQRGSLHLSQGSYTYAIYDFTEALKYEHQYFEAFCLRGEAHQRRGAISAALLDYQAALAIKPDWFEGHYNCGYLFSCQGSYYEAIKYLKQAIALRPAVAMSYFDAGMVYEKVNRYSDAKECFENFLANAGFKESLNRIKYAKKKIENIKRKLNQVKVNNGKILNG